MQLTNTEKLFLVNFFGVFGVLFAFFHYLSMDWLLNLIASVEAGILFNAGIHATVQGATIFTSKATFQIVAECSGLVMSSMLVALVFTTNVPKKFQNLLVFVPLLMGFNLIRLAVTLYFGATFGQGVLDVVHYALWFVDTGLVFWIWIMSVSKKDPLSITS